MSLENFYLLCKEEFEKNGTSMNDTLKAHGMHKPGKFCENVITEIFQSIGLTYFSHGKHTHVQLTPDQQAVYGKKKFQGDGYIPGLGMYLESKCHSFGMLGTCNEKLAGFLDKAFLYDKPCLLIFGGEFELRKHAESNIILAIDNQLDVTPQQKIIAENSFIGQSAKYLLEHKGLKICKLSNLRSFLLANI
jgi:hypothetical protein